MTHHRMRIAVAVTLLSVSAPIVPSPERLAAQAPPTVRLYPGPERPADQVAILTDSPTGFGRGLPDHSFQYLVSANGVDDGIDKRTGASLHLLPGRHVLGIGGFGFLRFTATAGHTYKLVVPATLTKGDLVRMPASALVTDLATNENVAEVLPTPVRREWPKLGGYFVLPDEGSPTNRDPLWGSSGQSWRLLIFDADSAAVIRQTPWSWHGYKREAAPPGVIQLASASAGARLLHPVAMAFGDLGRDLRFSNWGTVVLPFFRSDTFLTQTYRWSLNSAGFTLLYVDGSGTYATFGVTRARIENQEAIVENEAEFRMLLPHQHIRSVSPGTDPSPEMFVGEGTPVVVHSKELFVPDPLTNERGKWLNLIEMTPTQMEKLSGLAQKIARGLAEEHVKKVVKPRFYFTHAEGGDFVAELVVKDPTGKERTLLFREKE